MLLQQAAQSLAQAHKQQSKQQVRNNAECTNDDLDMLLEIIGLPSQINQFINMNLYAQATKQICFYFAKIRPTFINKNPQKIMKLVDKEIIGVLQQKLCKILAIKLQDSFEDSLATTEHYLKLLRNLTKCSPPESPVIEILRYKSIDYILYELLLNARSLFLKRELQHNVFQAFNGASEEQMQPSFVVI